jgi:hypothetical protein
MKNKYLIKLGFLGLAAFVSVSLSAQKPIELTDIQCVFSHGTHPGYSLVIPEAKNEDVSKSWTKKLERKTKSKSVIENGEYSIFGALIEEISLNPINVYSIIRSIDSATVLEVSFELKPKEFLSKDLSEKEYAKVKNYLYRFGKEEYVEVAKNQLKNEEKILKTMKRETSSIRNKKEKLEKNIVEEQNKIYANNNEIDLLKVDASYKNNQIASEREVLLGISDAEAEKAKETQIKTLEKEKKKILKEIESLQKKSLECESNIHTAELDIEVNITSQKKKISEVNEQILKVDKSAAKLTAIMNY